MIGIVGGVGPYAGIDLLKKVYDNTNAHTDQEHLDTALLSLSSSIKDRTEYLEGKIKENPANAITKVLLRLERIGVTVAGIPCNTAHSEGIFDVIQKQLKVARSSLKLLNMITETIKFIKQNYPDIKTIGVLSTTGTYNSGIYSKEILKEGYKIIVPTMKIQKELIHPAIYDFTYGIKSFSNPIKRKAIENLQKGILFLKIEGAEAVILGCTEIPLAISQKKVEGVITIDPTNILARALIENYLPDKLKKYNYND